jgi:hypothetical protein
MEQPSPLPTTKPRKVVLKIEGWSSRSPNNRATLQRRTDVKVAGVFLLPPHFFEISEKAQKSQESRKYFSKALFIDGGRTDEILYRYGQPR